MERVVTSFIVFSILSVLLSGCSGGSSGGSEPIEPTAAHFEAPNTQNIFLLNDTGCTNCISNAGITACDPAIHLPQDGMYGRDFQSQTTLSKLGGGFAGYDFLKIDENGNAFSDQQADFDTTPWSCVYDVVTGLTWEVKTIENTLRNWTATYSWYDPDFDLNGGDAGIQNGGACQFGPCDTQSFIDAVNISNLCGFNDWRLPTRQEFNSIVNYNFGQPNVVMHDSMYFPFGYNSNAYWTVTTDSEQSTQAWVFDSARNMVLPKNLAASIRLVRSTY